MEGQRCIHLVPGIARLWERVGEEDDHQGLGRIWKKEALRGCDAQQKAV
jgi:hypothetical protein